jgi:hypothetical protein
MGPRALLFVAAVGLASGCSRTTLFVAGGAGGHGGAGGGAGATASGGAGAGAGGGGEGGGGREPGCQMAGPVARLAGGTGMHQVRPELVAADDGVRVTLLSAWSATMETPPIELRHTTFAPWTAWPEDGTVEPSFLAALDSGYSFAAARQDGGLLAAMHLAPDATAATLRFALAPSSGAPGNVREIALDDASRVLSLGQVRGSAGGSPPPAAFGAVRSGAVSSRTLLVLAHDDAAIAPTVTEIGCAVTAVDAATVAVLEGVWLAAVSSGSCAFDFVEADVRLLLLRADWATGALPPADQIEVGAEIRAVRAAPHPRGAWLAWSSDQGSAAAVEGALLDTQAMVARGPFPLSAGNLAASASLAAAALGERLAVAFVVDDAESPGLHLRIHDATGAVRFEHGLGVGDSIRPEVALVGSPDGTMLVVAWSERVADRQQIHLARIRCL